MNFARLRRLATLVGLGLTQFGCALEQASEEETVSQVSSAIDAQFPLVSLREVVPQHTGDWSGRLPGLSDTYLYGITGNEFQIFGYSGVAAVLSFGAQVTYTCPNSPDVKTSQFWRDASFGGGFSQRLECVPATWSLVVGYHPDLRPGVVPFGDGYLTTATGYNFYTTVSLLGAGVSTVSRTWPIDIPPHQAGQSYTLIIRYANHFGASGIKVGFQSAVDGSTLKAVPRVNFSNTAFNKDYMDWRYTRVDFTPTSSWGTSFYARLQYVDGADTALDSAWILPI